MRVCIFLTALLASAAMGLPAGLDVPATVPAGSEFPVTSTIEPANGHMVLVRLPDGKRASYGYPKIGRPVLLTAPIEPGEYEVQYTVGGEAIESRKFTVTAVTAKLAVPETLDMRQSFDAVFEGPANKGDMILVRDADEKRLSYGYPGAEKSGAVALTAPESPGDYEVVYRSKGVILAREPVSVRSVGASLKVPESLDMRQAFSVEFEGPANHGDMIFVSDADNKRYSYGYPGDAKSGALELMAPENSGAYSVVYRTGETILAEVPIVVGATTAQLEVSATVPSGSELDIGFRGPANRGDMIFIAKKDETERSGDYGYPGARTEGALSLTAPEPMGDYSVIYRSGSTELARASFAVVDVTASLDAPPEVQGGLSFDVAWKAEGNRGDRINLVAIGDPSPVAWNYPVRGNPLRLEAPAQPGGYQLEYRTPSGRVLATRAIKVTPPDPKPGFLQVRAEGKGAFGEGSGVEIILDASGSMLQRIGGERRIAIAKATLTELVTDVIPAGTPFAMRVFGHRQADSCRTDLEVPLGPLAPAAVSAKVAAIQAMNLARTPIGDSLAKVSSDLAAVNKERIVILLTDGEETCEGDPAAAIRELKATSVDVRVNIVGFAIDDTELARTFESWAALGNGDYFAANDAAELGRALTRSVRPQFEVLDGSGKVTARGRVGEPAIALPAGDYQVRLMTRGAESKSVEIEGGATAIVDFP